MKDLTSTSYAVLGLLAAQPRTTYELATQVARGLRLVWPRAEARIYDEPKLLLDHGLARAKREYTGRRPRTVYSITPKGRRALRQWLTEPARGPTLEYETLLKVAYANDGTKADLLSHISAIHEHAATLLALGRTRAGEYVNGLVPLPANLAVNALMWNFLWHMFSAVEDWAAWAETEVTRWPDDVKLTTEAKDRALQLLKAALDTPAGA